MRRLVTDLIACLDDILALQVVLLDGVRAQRGEIVSGDRTRIERAALAMEADILRLGALESQRNTIAAELADELGCVASRWSVLREYLDPAERSALGRRVADVERLIRDLELENTINHQLVRIELELVDMSVRTLVAPDPRHRTRAYAAGGQATAPAGTGPVLLNLAA
ncbi:MAG: flagellar export chaperone FlgN [Thermoleophilia bacterium]